jgi:hypothetical protein
MEKPFAMMLNYKKIREEFLNGIGDSISHHGFKFNKKAEHSEKAISGGLLTIYFLRNYYGIKVIFIPWWGIRIDQITDIYNSITEKDEKYYRDSQVFANSLGPLIDYIDNGKRNSKADQKRFIVLKDEDEPIIVSEVTADINKYIIPYFEQNNSVERADQLLNYDPVEQSVHMFSYPYKVMMGLIAAKLNNNPDYKKIISSCNPEMEGAADYSHREYAKLKIVLA